MTTTPVSRLVALAAAPLLVSGCTRGVLDPQGPVGRAERLILYDATAIMLAVVIPVIVGTLVVAWWFRAGNKHAERQLEWDYSGRIEFVTWSIPAMIVLFLGGIAWIGSHDLDPRKPLSNVAKPVEVEVVSLDWKWLFIYPQEQLATVNELVIPVDTPVHFRLTSSSVMNSFFIPQLGSQIYTMAGMTTRLNLMASRPGNFSGLSAQFSGDGFSDMRFEVRAVPRGEYEAWLESTRSRSESLDEARYARLAIPSSADTPSAFGHVSQGLFETIVHGHGTAELSSPAPASENNSSF